MFFRNKITTTEEIIAGCCMQDPRCQKLLFQKYSSLLMTICRRYEHPNFGASDILQESFILIFKNIKSFDPSKAGIETWMKKITVNTALKAIRKRKMSFLDIEDHFYQLELPVHDDIPIARFTEEELLAAIASLPDGYRLIFNLFVIEGYSHQEIAEILKISQQTSKSQLSKAKKLLRKRLNKKSDQKASDSENKLRSPNSILLK